MTKARTVVTETTSWQGIILSVSYEADWLNIAAHGGKLNTAHLEVRSIAPENAPLPITETGYRSHFIPAAMVKDAGGAIAFVQAWLDASAKSVTWKNYVAQSRQLSLF